MKAERKPEKSLCLCPYCDEPVDMTPSAFCKACKVTLFFCPECKKPVTKGSRTCPTCGAKINR